MKIAGRYFNSLFHAPLQFNMILGLVHTKNIMVNNKDNRVTKYLFNGHQISASQLHVSASTKFLKTDTIV